MNRLPHYPNIHTHAPAPCRGAVVCFDPTEITSLPQGEGPVSIGIHPWNADKADASTWERFMAMLADPRTVAIGECGLDRAKGADTDTQTAVFLRQAIAADEKDMPLIIHCVRATDLLLALRRKLKPRNQWIIHGFRGKEAAAKQLLAAGIDLSFGPVRNENAFAATPADRRYEETD